MDVMLLETCGCTVLCVLVYPLCVGLPSLSPDLPGSGCDYRRMKGGVGGATAKRLITVERLLVRGQVKFT